MAKVLTRRKAVNIEPIQIGCFTLAGTGLMVQGHPTFDEFAGVGDFVQRAHKAAGWWLADWIAYGEARAEWKDRFDALMGVDQLTEQTVRQYRYIAKSIPPSNRIDGVGFGHHAVVASLPVTEQAHWLETAKIEGWSQRELRRELRASQRRQRLEGQAVVAGMYRVVYADPPWSSVTIEELTKLPVAAHVQPNSVLFMWVPAPVLLQNPGPREVLEAWGFTYKTHGIWNRVLGSFGNYLEITHENLIIATRGDCQPDAPTSLPKSVFTERQQAGDTRPTPAGIRREWVERLYTRGPYLSVYGHEAVEGWTLFGGDPAQWASAAFDRKLARTEVRA